VREELRQLQDCIGGWCRQQHQLLVEHGQLLQQAMERDHRPPASPPVQLTGFHLRQRSRVFTEASQASLLHMPELDRAPSNGGCVASGTTGGTMDYTGIVPSSPGGFSEPCSSQVTPRCPQQAFNSLAVLPGGEPTLLVRSSDEAEGSQPELPNIVNASEGMAVWGNAPCRGPWARQVSEESAKEREREQWTRHLQRRVSIQLGQKHYRRTSSRNSEDGGIPLPAPESSPLQRRAHEWRTGVVQVLNRVVRSALFTYLCATVIILNVIMIGYSSTMSMQNVLAVPPEENPAWFETSNRVFTAFYSLELGLRLMAFGSEFWRGPDRRWHAFDAILVVTSLAEECVQNIDINVGSLRVIRGMRMFRVLRIIRVMRYFRDLRLMVCSIMQSLGSLSWALLLLFLIMYLFTIVFMQGAIMYLDEQQVDDGQFEVIRDGVIFWYGSVFDTMYTLMASIVGGVSWTDVVRPLEKISLVYRALYAFYIAFVVIGVLNVLTGIFVERACELSGLDRDLVIQTQLKRDETFLMEMQRIFEEADADGSGSISWEEFKGYLENDRVKAYLATQQLDAFDARTLFDILNKGNGEEMSIETFIVGCRRLKGLAKSVDLVAVLQETRSLGRKLKAFMRRIEGGTCGTMDFVAKSPTISSGMGFGHEWRPM